MASKLGIYNSALLLLEERGLASLAASGNSKSALDDAWDDSVAYCLESGFWTFAMRTVKLDASQSITPAFGLAFAFEKPDDWVRSYRIASDERLNVQLFDLADEGRLWYSDADPIYVKYVSNDGAYGGDLGKWSATFAEFVAARLALKTCVRITGSASRLEGLTRLERRARNEASAKDSMNEPPVLPVQGTWAASRAGATGFAPPSGRSIG